jgi:nicotinamide-nucleotide amidase
LLILNCLFVETFGKLPIIFDNTNQVYTMNKQITAEIITIGDEILFGQIIDTNSSYIGAQLSDIGIQTIRRSSVGDHKQAILTVLDEASKRANLIIITGGLGPTKDDITKHTLCEYFDTHLIENETALAHVTAIFERIGRIITDTNKSQALLPASATYIQNNFGTAPCMWFEKDGIVYVSLPGVPSEMKGIFEEKLLPKFKEYFKTEIIYHKIIRTTGIGESYLSDLISDWEANLPQHIKLAYLPSWGDLKLRLTSKGKTLEQLEKDTVQQIEKFKTIAGQYMYGTDNDSLVGKVAQLCQDQNLTLATAESCTGGYLSHQFTSLSGSSAYFLGGMVCYSNEVKINQLGVATSIIEKYGAVSEECAKAMASQIKSITGASIGMATTGIAGPSGGTETKPVGTVHIAIATNDGVFHKKLRLGGNRTQIIQLSTINIVNLLRKYLLKESLL